MARTVSDDSTPCVCGHTKAAHEHYRRGSDCALCGAATCGRFRPASSSGRRRFGGRPVSPEIN